MSGRKKKTNKKEDAVYSDFAYDDAYRTMESECDDLLIPFVNYFHNENYGSSAKIIRGRNEHFIEGENHSEQKRITDSAFEIVDNGKHRLYHHECESKKYDDTLLVRMFEYDVQVALDSSEIEEHCLRVDMPYSGILLLRGSGDFDKAYVKLSTPGGNVEYPIAIRRMSELGVEDIFEKHLYMLLPFYIFNMEGSLSDINEDSEKLEEFSDTYRDILSRLEKEVEHGNLSVLSYGVIIRMIHRVAYKMTMKEECVQKKVGDIMGGKVLELDIIVAHRQGRTEGIAEGRTEGRREGKTEERAENISKLAAHYMSTDPSLSKEEATKMATEILA